MKSRMNFSSKKIKIGLAKGNALPLVIAALSAASGLSQGAVAVSNLGIADNGLADGYAVNGMQYLAMSFTVGTESTAWSLDSVDFKANAGPGALLDFVVELHADSGSGSPSVPSLVTFTGENPSEEGIYNFVPVSAFTLSAGVTYWLTAEQLPSPGSYSWIFTSPLSGAESTALDGWSIGNNLSASPNGGASWDVYDNAPAKFAVNATPVPEPSAMAFAWLALGGWAGYRTRKEMMNAGRGNAG